MGGGNEVGTISFAGKPKAQVQIVEGKDGTRRVNVYTTDGVYLCGSDFNGDNETGFERGQALFDGYIAGWNNCQYAISKEVTKSLYGIHWNE